MGSGRYAVKELVFLFRPRRSGILNFGTQDRQTHRRQGMKMTEKSTSKGGGRYMAQDGYRPGLLTEGYKSQIAAIPGKVQGGYTGPSGGGKPSAPTTGSGVAPAAPNGGKK